MQEPEERNNIYNFPKSGKPLDYAPQLRMSGYYFYTPEGTFLNYDKLQRDLDALGNDSACNCTGECNCDHGNAGGSVSIDPVSGIVQGLGNIAQAFKKGENAQEISQRIREAKQQCPKKPFIALTKKAKERKAAYTQCMADISKAEKEFQLEMARLGRTPEGTRIQTEQKEEKGKNLALWIGVSAAFILLVIVLIIWIRRMKKQKPKS